MTDQPQQPATPPNPASHPERFEFFAFVVDGEVTMVIPVLNEAELLIASWSSDPKVVRLTEGEKNVVKQGDLLDVAERPQP